MKNKKRMLAVFLAAALAVSGMPLTAHAEMIGVKPEDGTTEGQPFPSGTGGSQNFRIPGLVTLNDGTLVAACDARWNHAGDACSLDTIVSYSKDNGANWNYTFANYLGDYGNQKHLEATAFIDPAVATDGETVYMIADLFPGGYGLNTAPRAPVAGQNGFDENGDLRLSTDNRSSYAYHLEKNAEGEDSYYLIKENGTGNVVEGYTVDAYFNLTGNGVDTNLFCSDSPYLVYPTDYLYLTSSEDGGKTWSVPSLLDLKKEAEQTLLVGPGRGIVTSTGRIVFTAYEFTRGDKNSCCFYSDDKGETWVRGESVSGWSSEATVTEANGKLYMFTRHGGYYVSDDWGETWTDRIEVGVSYNEGCQLSAITYSKLIDGCPAILLSAPSNTSSRSAGKLFVGLVQDDGSISWDYTYSVNGSAYYAYSCLTELNDGSIGLLYENAGAAITYLNLPVEEIAEGAQVSRYWCEYEGERVDSVNIKPGESITLQVMGMEEDAELTASSDREDLLKVRLRGDQLRLTGGALNGSAARGVVTLTDGTDVLRLKVNVSELTDFTAVDLCMGETYVIDRNTSDFQVEDDTIVSVTAVAGGIQAEALQEGATKVTVGGETYVIFVKNREQKITLQEGESVVVKGAVVQKEADASVAALEKNEGKAPYEAVRSVTEGTYLIGNSTHIVINTDSQADNPRGRAMRAANYKNEDLSDYMWTLAESGEGYTMQYKDGKYLCFEESTANSCNIVMRDEPQTLNLVERGDGFGITNGTHYMNNYGNNNVRAAGWNENNNTWYLYRTADSYKITGVAEGRTMVTISGTNYYITVGEPISEEVEAAFAVLEQELGKADAFLQNPEYAKEELAGLQAAYDAAQALKEDKKAQTTASIAAAMERLNQEMEALSSKKPEPEPKPDNPSGGNNGTGDQTVNPPVTQTPQPGPNVGDIKTVNGALYQVRSADTVAYLKPEKAAGKTVSVPDAVSIQEKTYKVTEIADQAFRSSKKLKQAVIGANIEKIGKSAFEKCKNLKKITIRSAVLKQVGKKAISGIHKKCVIKAPKQKIAAYKKLFKGKGLQSTMKIKK